MTIILYGSKARRDDRKTSDVDIIYAHDGNGIASPSNFNGVSLHRYGRTWLSNEAKKGSLFVYHVAFEGVALEDPDNFLDSLRSSFVGRNNYDEEISTASLILKFLLERNWGDSEAARRRYFWAVRTILISSAANTGTPVFSAKLLEETSKVHGLAKHIESRDEVTFEQCVRIGAQILQSFLPSRHGLLHGDGLRSYLAGLGGIAAESVRIVEEGEAIEAGSSITYL